MARVVRRAGRLVAAGRRAVHRALGLAGVTLAVVIAATAFAAALETIQVRGGFGGTRSGVDRLYSNILLSGFFAACVAVAAALRRRPALHKRLMLLATVALIAPAITRAAVMLLGPGGVDDPHVPVIAALVAAAMIHEWRTRGRTHWILPCGGALLIVLQLTRRAVGTSEAWAAVAEWLIR